MIAKIFQLINNYQKYKIIFFFIIAILLKVSDILGALSLSILVSYLTDSTKIFENKIPYLFEIIGYVNIKAFFVVLIITSTFFFISIFLRTFYGYQVVKFNNEIKIYIGKKIFKKFLNISYPKFTKYTYAEILTLFNFESERFSGCLASIIKFNEGIITIIILFVSLSIIDVNYLIYFVLFTFIFYLLYKFFKPSILSNDVILRESNIKMDDTILETISNIKLIKIQKIFSYFINRYIEDSRNFAKARTTHQFLPIITRSLIEFVLFSIFIVLIIVLIKSDQYSIKDLLPIITFFLVLAYRLLPSFLTMYNAFVSLSASKTAINSISKNLEIEDEKVSPSGNLNFNKNLTIQKIFFRYSDKSNFTHSNFSLEINKNSLNVILGKSGSGKSTLLDIICGLIRPSEGNIYIDNQLLDSENISSWQNKIGYMGQELVLLNANIKNNIEFGSSAIISEKDYKDNLNKFFEKDEIIKFESKDFLVGDRGSKLSFGQRQRVILARQFLSDKEIILLDEPTSSLDNENILKLKSAIKKIKGKKTIIITTHNEIFNDIADKLIKL